MRRGEFDRLPGAGKPIAGLDGAHDELWWVRRKLAEEQVEALPRSLQLRRRRELTVAAAMACTDEGRVRTMLEELNTEIRTLNRYGAPGPPSTLMPLDVDEFVERWRSATPAETSGE